jgi:hypothetical protein
MAEIVKFHQHVEQQLACLTDEAQVLDLVSLQRCVVVDKLCPLQVLTRCSVALQVLARFEGFPSKKLGSLRMAAALYSKLDGAVSTLKGWKLATPVSQQLDKVESYFNKVLA